MITEQYVEFSTAKLLNEKGYDGPSTFQCDEEAYRWNAENSIKISNPNYDPSIPFDDSTLNVTLPHVTQSIVMRWLREVHNIHIDVVFLGPSLKWTPTIWKIDTKIPESHHIKSTMNTWETYEEATEIAIKYCLENLI